MDGDPALRFAVCLAGVLSESLWRDAIEAGVAPDGVVVGPLGVDDRPSVGKVAE